MKSLQVQNMGFDDGEVDRYSELKVLRSAAGYYIGTTYTDEDGFIEPGSRDSEYFKTHDEAATALRNGTWSQRMTP